MSPAPQSIDGRLGQLQADLDVVRQLAAPGATPADRRRARELARHGFAEAQATLGQIEATAERVTTLGDQLAELSRSLEESAA